MKLILLPLLGALLIACQTPPPLEPGASEPRAPGNGSECAATCDHWERIGCEEAQPSPVKGITCEERCRGIEEFEALPHECIQDSITCEESRECEL